MITKLQTIADHLRAAQLDMKEFVDGSRHKTDMELLDEALALGQRLNRICRELKQRMPSEFDSALEENKDMLHDVQNNLAGIKMHYYMIAKKPVDPCTCGECDSCVAARSDEHYDRKHDGCCE